MAVESSHVAGLKAEAMASAGLNASDYLVVLPVAVCFLFGAGLLMLRKRTDWQPYFAIPGLVLLFVVDVALLLKVAAEGPQTMMMGGWKAPFGIAFTVDLMGALFATVAGFVALCCGIYAAAAISKGERRYGFYPFLFLMIGGVSGAFLTGDVFNLYVWFEVLLIGSFGLLILGSEHEQLDGATKYCFLNLVGTTLFLIATGYLYGIFGTLNMADIAQKAATMKSDGVITTLAVLYLVSFAMKAAAFPLNYWLPASYHTPRFVVSALFAGLLTKVGIYAMIRILMMLFPPERAAMAPLIAWIAGLTMLVGGFGALAQTDLRRLLNYIVIAGIGTILAGIALPPVAASMPALLTAATDAAAGVAASADKASQVLQTGLSGAIYYALHSIVVMTGLYLAAGVAAYLNGSSSLAEMGGLWRRHPMLAAIMLVFLFSVSGLPPFSGFWPKVALVRASIAADMPWLAAAVLFSGFLITVASARLFALAFWRPLPAAQAAGDEAEAKRVAGEMFQAAGPDKPLSLIPLLALVAFVVAAGVWPEWLARLTDGAAAGVLDPTAYFSSVFGGGS
ncbi:proton-conducting transporter membrane subunit [Aurantimonas sp. VKM B-3413]|uniref:proton-conducting transporter transmembrane domain-containing protein n=1 Tax=Aurantimonas sp. VKM B-3413 TaxID=2779401 RepID=UPI001E5FD0AE|nr:proton-conducting transporter membrane subunit [Aurantimonas sp. VKM B-3413]MCB8837839.1 Na+/H+ antiporter subunit D [Aurantimonas sp. VKM B-3413]